MIEDDEPTIDDLFAQFKKWKSFLLFKMINFFDTFLSWQQILKLGTYKNHNILNFDILLNLIYIELIVIYIQ